MRYARHTVRGGRGRRQLMRSSGWPGADEGEVVRHRGMERGRGGASGEVQHRPRQVGATAGPARVKVQQLQEGEADRLQARLRSSHAQPLHHRGGRADRDRRSAGEEGKQLRAHEVADAARRSR
eukprot:748319-Hanusia_phi.AAC.6